MAAVGPQARHIRCGAAELRLWGDHVSGQVNDWILHLGERTCHLAIRFHPNTWHHGFSVGPDELRVLEFFAPAVSGLGVPPAGDGYGMAQPDRGPFQYVRDDLLERWPAGYVNVTGATVRVLAGVAPAYLADTT